MVSHTLLADAVRRAIAACRAPAAAAAAAAVTPPRAAAAAAAVWRGDVECVPPPGGVLAPAVAEACARTPFMAATRCDGRPAPTIILDLDETILFRERGVWDAVLLYAGPSSAHVGTPYAHAVATLLELARTYTIVAVTARWKPAEVNTEAWLARVGLRGLPVLYATQPHVGDDSRIAFKAAAIGHVREQGLQPIVGIGDRPSDVRAYLRARIMPAMVAHAEGAGAAHHAHCAKALARLRASAAKEPPPAHPLTVPRYYTDSPLAAAQHADVVATSTLPLPPVWSQLSAFLHALPSSLPQRVPA